MKKRYKFNYVFVMYDIAVEESEAGKNRVAKVFKVCKKYLNHHQKSIFLGESTPSNLLKLRKELLEVIDQDLDTITIVKLPSASSFEEEQIGVVHNGRFL